MKQQTRAYILAGTSVLLWSTVATAFKLTLAETHFAVMLLISGMASFAVLLVAAVVERKLAMLSRLRPGQIAFSAFLGLLNPFIYYLVLFRAYDLLPAQQAQPLNYIWPVVLVVFTSILFKHKLRWRVMASMGVCFSGVAVIATHGDFATLRISSPPGVALALGSSVIWASYWALGMRDTVDSIVRLLLNFGFGIVYTFLFVLFGGIPIHLTTTGLVGSIYIGFFEMGLTFLLWMKALRATERASQISSLVFFSPFISLIFIAFVLGEHIHPSTIAGLALIITGVFWNARNEGELKIEN